MPETGATGRRAAPLVVFVGLFLLLLCGGGLWASLHVADLLGTAGIDGGDGLHAVGDPRPGRLVVRVTDDEGRPVAGATVEAIPEPAHWGDFVSRFGFDPASDPVPSRTLATDADGAAVIERFPEGRWHLVVRAEGRATAFRWVEGGHAQRHEIPVQLGVPHRLRGRLLEPTGGPAEGFVVLAVASSDRHFRDLHWIGAVRATTDASGAFVMDGLARGVVSLWAVPPACVPLECGRVLVPYGQSLDVVLPPARTPITVQVQPPRTAIEDETVAPADASHVQFPGTVRSADGEPIGGACVEILHKGPYESEEPLAWTHTGDDGAFVQQPIPAGAHVAVRINAPGHMPLLSSWGRASDLAGRTWTLTRAARIDGRLRTPDGSVPRDAKVWIYRFGGDRRHVEQPLSCLWAGCPPWWSVASQTPLTGPGRFETAWTHDPGRLVAYVVADGWAPAVSEPFDVGVGGGPVAVTIDLRPGVTLSARLVDAVGAPLVRRPVRIRPPGYFTVWGATAAVTDDDGRFEIPHLAPGPLLVGSPGAGSVRVTPGAEPVELVLRRGAHPDGLDPTEDD